ncbi:hypothetical protein QMP26_41685 (plasmid) [Enterocloster clostridioformis]
MERQYEVYHSLMRNAQIYIGNESSAEGRSESDWRDYKADPLLDIVRATDEVEAVRLVAIEERIPECNLYAIEHVLNLKTSINQTGNLYPEMFEIAGKGNGQECMLEIWLSGACICNLVITDGACHKSELLGLQDSMDQEIDIFEGKEPKFRDTGAEMEGEERGEDGLDK